ncbi:hypothetical protein I3843_11G129900 [Carya illinoinensis]|nr:hypothetical protein I3843_11G129900 [Carya illinoinensis]
MVMKLRNRFLTNKEKRRDRSGAKSVEDVEIERQLKILNKPYIKSIKTAEGDIFDCIDIYKQPAFDHPLLKNHSIQLKPSAFPEEMREVDEPSPPLAKLSVVFWNLGENVREKLRVELWLSFSSRLPGTPGKLYLGAGARINTQNPQVTNTQFSQAFVLIQSGVEVNPTLFGDNATRTFGAWTAGKGTGCFNMLCSGFVQVNSEFPLGYVISKISEYDGEQYYVSFKIFKDIKSGNWWLGHDESLDKLVGYWPNSLFSILSGYATEITWGGGVLTDNNAVSPPMGSGHFADEGYARAAYEQELQIVVLLFLSFIVISNTTEGAKSVEDLEIDRQLKILNKPYIKSITTAEGDIFDCIDIYKQPAFDHPLLKNHSIQMKPSSFPERVGDKTLRPAAKTFADGLNEGCPFGTVPIKRTRKEDLLWAKMFGKYSGMQQENYLAVQANIICMGAAAIINIQNPQVINNQFSQAFVQIRSGVDVIQVGWMFLQVNPNLHGDNTMRTFGAWTAGENGCFSMLCLGFVQVYSKYPLGYVLDKVSRCEGVQHYVKFHIIKDTRSGNWGLVHGQYGRPVGYWPNSLFESLSISATEIRWGGGVYTDNNATSPPMGSGHFAYEGYSRLLL